MNRILRRPMFRMGGTPNEGIMTGLTNPRMGYADGSGPGLDQIIARKKTERKTLFTEPYIQNEYAKFLEDTKNKIAFGGVPETDIDLGMQIAPLPSIKDEAILEFAEKQPEEAYKAFKRGDKKMGGKDFGKVQTQQISDLKAGGAKVDFGLGQTTKTDTEEELKKLKNLTSKDSSTSEFEKYFKEYLPVIQEQLKPDTDASKRAKFLELAKVGLNILGQPGGNIAQVVGRAAAPSITNIQKMAEKDREERLQPRLLALQAAMKRMEGPTAAELTINARRLEAVAENLVTNYGLSADASYKAANSLDDLRTRKSPLAGKFNKKRPAEEKDLPKKGKHYYFTDDGDLTVYDADNRQFLDIKEAEAIST